MGLVSIFSVRPDRLLRVALLAALLMIVGAGGLHFSSLTCVSSTAPILVAATESSVSPAPADQRKSAWPRAALRLWLLVPQILPTHDR
jgi:NO-binding membrane sensor protein with MHYT domain